MKHHGIGFRAATAAGGSLAALTAYAWAAPASAYAAASGCTGEAGGGSQCMDIDGSGQYVNPLRESAWSAFSPFFSICSYQAKWTGDTTANGWKSWYSSYHAGCSYNTAYFNKNVSPDKMVNHSYFYGYWKDNRSGNVYRAPVRETITA